MCSYVWGGDVLWVSWEGERVGWVERRTHYSRALQFREILSEIFAIMWACFAKT
jgi:hypothetical protein